MVNGWCEKSNVVTGSLGACLPGKTHWEHCLSPVSHVSEHRARVCIDGVDVTCASY